MTIGDIVKKILIPFDVTWGKTAKDIKGRMDNGAYAALIGDVTKVKQVGSNSIVNLDDTTVFPSGGHFHGSLDSVYLKLDGSNDPITGNITINVDSTTAFLVEQDGVHDNVLLVDTSTTEPFVEMNADLYVKTGPSFTFRVFHQTGAFSANSECNIAGNLIIDGNDDFIQLRVQGHSTQTNNIFELEQSDGTDIFTIANNGNTNWTNVDVGAIGVVFETYHNSSSPANDDVIFKHSFYGENDADEKFEYARYEVVIGDVGDGSEEAFIKWYTTSNEMATPAIQTPGIAMRSSGWDRACDVSDSDTGLAGIVISGQISGSVSGATNLTDFYAGVFYDGDIGTQVEDGTDSAIMFGNLVNLGVDRQATGAGSVTGNTYHTQLRLMPTNVGSGIVYLLGAGYIDPITEIYSERFSIDIDGNTILDKNSGDSPSLTFIDGSNKQTQMYQDDSDAMFRFETTDHNFGFNKNIWVNDANAIPSPFFYLGSNTNWLSLVKTSTAAIIFSNTGKLALAGMGDGSNYVSIETDTSRPVIQGEGSNDLVIRSGSSNLLLGDSLTIGEGAAGVDYSITFDGQDNDGVITWKEDEAEFNFDSDVDIDGLMALGNNANISNAIVFNLNHTFDTQTTAYGLGFQVWNTATGGAHSGNFVGIYGLAAHDSANNSTGYYIGLDGLAQLDSAATLTNAWAGYFKPSINDGNAGTITNAVSCFLAAPDKGDSGTITNAYGLYVNEVTDGSTINREIFCAGAGGTYYRQGTEYVSSKNANYLDLDAATGIRLNSPVTTGTWQGTAIDAAYIDEDVKTSTVGITIDGGGAVITTGVKGDVQVPYDGTIQSWHLMADQSGSIVIDVWKDVWANYPPTVADTIAGTEKPTLAAATNNEDTNLTTWTTAVTEGDTIRFNVDSVTTVTRVTLVIKILKT